MGMLYVDIGSRRRAPLLISAQLFLLHAARNGLELPFLNYHTYHIL